jgi:UDPglucose--hexose-1-phosphate uridylyltransferase
MNNDLQEFSHKRFNILTGEWVLVSPHRTKRPWQGQEEETNLEKQPPYDKNCYLCPRNIRANGKTNSNYDSVFVFENDFAALQNDSSSYSLNEGLLKAESEQGVCKVVCFSPDHSKSLAQMKIYDIEKVIETWQKEYLELSKKDNINYIQIFENKGAIMGCSNPHPHGQIWAQSSIPNEVLKKNAQQKKHYENYQSSLLVDYLTQELKNDKRILFENDDFVLLVPFWAIWPYETMIIPKQQQISIKDSTIKQRHSFAEAISKITKAYDKLFNCSFPYSSGIHQAPTDGKNNEYWHWHMSFYPPLLRSVAVKKFMVGYEMFGMPQRDITPEVACEQLKKLLN